MMDLFTAQAAADLAMYYTECGEYVDVESGDGETTYYGVLAIFSFGRGNEYRGSDIPGTDGEIRLQVSDVDTVSAGYMVYRGTEQWRILGGGDLSEDGLEWLLPISRLTN